MPKTADQVFQILQRLGRGVIVAPTGPGSWLVRYRGHPIVVMAPPNASFIVAHRNLADLGPTPSAALLRRLLELGANHRCVKACLPPRNPQVPQRALGLVGVMGELWNGPSDAPFTMPDGPETVHRLIEEVVRLSGAAAAEIQRAGVQAPQPPGPERGVF